MEPDNDIIYLGQRHDFGGQRPFGLGLPERRQHVYVIGQTGTGKSSLLHNAILQDIEAGRGVGLIDPHGDLAYEILDHIPSWRAADVVYFDPSAPDPLSLNLFRASNDNWHIAAAGIVSAFKKYWADSWGPRLEYILYATVAALLQSENTSFLGVSRMLSDDRYRAWVVRNVKDPMVRHFWEQEFERYGKAYRQEAVGPVQNKVGQLFLAPMLRNVLGQVGSKIRFRAMMDAKRIFIANLSKGKIGEAQTDLLGSLLVTGFELAALSRTDVPHYKRHGFYLYADEFQHCATDSFASVLSEARKYGLFLTLAHQYIGQIGETIRAAVFGNVGSFLAFRTSEEDAKILERQYGAAYPAARFTGLENFELCAKLLNREPFIGTSLPPVITSRKRRDEVISWSRSQYGTAGAVVENRIERWLANRY